MRLKTSIKKISAIGLSLAMTIGMVPIWSTQALAETAQKAYEVILEPTMVYDNVYSSFGNKLKWFCRRRWQGNYTLYIFGN